MKGTARRYLQTPSKFLFAQMQFLQYVEKVIRYICDLHLEEIQSKLLKPKAAGFLSVTIKSIIT